METSIWSKAIFIKKYDIDVNMLKMNDHVRLLVADVVEPFSTHFTLVRFLSRVDPLMCG